MKRRSKRQRFGRFLGVSLMAFALVLSAVPAEGVIAEEGEQTVSEAGDFTIENGVLTKYNGRGGDVVIPEGVTEIGTNAFYACRNLASVTIPDGVTKIGYGVFQYCGNLTNVTIPDSVTEIGELAFNSTGLTSIAILDSVTKIDEWAFIGCRIASIAIPSSMAEIGKNAFSGSGITSIIIPESVTKIREFAFYECRGLTSVTIPASVTQIGDCAFGYCTSMENITVDSNNQIYDSRENCNAIIETGANKLIAGCKNTIIPYGISEIGYGAFSGCSGLTSVAIPDSVTVIGNSAFFWCSGLTGVTIPDGVAEISDYAFSGCNGLNSITIPENVTTIGMSILSECENLTDITVLNKNVMLYGYDAVRERKYCILGVEGYGESIEYFPNNSKTITFRGYSNSTTQQFAKLLDEHKVEAELDTVTFIALDGGSTGDETKDNVAAVIQEGNNPPAYNGYDSALVSATVNGVKGTPILKVEAGSSIISGYISSNNLVDSQHDFDCVGYSLSLVDEAGSAVTEFTDCIVTLPLPTGWADKNGTFWIGSIKPDGQFERIAANVVDVQGQKCIQFTTILNTD